MDERKEAVWMGLNRKQSLRAALGEYQSRMGSDPTGALIFMASEYFSWAKTYLPWMPWMAVTRWYQAVVHVRNARRVDPRRFATLGPNELDIASTILGSWPWQSQEERSVMIQAITRAVSGNEEDVLPHTRALLRITLSQHLWKRGDERGARKYMEEVTGLLNDIYQEESEDWRQQLVRVLASVGYFYARRGRWVSERDYGEKALRTAYRLAQEHARSQTRKIRFLAWRAGVGLAEESEEE